MSEFDALVLFFFAVTMLYDIWLIACRKRTISQAYQRLFPTWADLLALGTVVVALVELPLQPELKVLLAVTAGHLFWPNKETHL